MDHDMIPIFVCAILFIGLPWIVLHYVTRWKTAPTLTSGDEQLLDELYKLATRLDERMDTVERIVAADNPDYQPNRLLPDREADNQPLHEIDRLYARQGRTAK